MTLVTHIFVLEGSILKRLECRSCKCTDSMMINVIKAAPQLNYLDLSHCQHITNRMLEEAVLLKESRTNNTILKIFAGGTSVDLNTLYRVSPFVVVDLTL